MNLSDAILLGDGLKRAEHMVYLDIDDGDICGCAIGGALLATGVLAEEWFGAEKDWVYGEVPLLIKTRWPWLTHDVMSRIGVMYSLSRRKDFPVYTLEEIVEYVKSIEPVEDETTEELWTDSKTAMEREHSIKGI